MTPFKTFSNGDTLAFGPGKFDNFCIYYTNADGTRWFPLDREYFETMARLAAEHTRYKVYSDFCCVYDRTTKDLDTEILDDITRMSFGYGVDRLVFDTRMSVIYAGMVAEENKADTKLGKRIKRLGMHQVLHGKLSPREAADFSRGMPWPLISVHCKCYGF
jgi:hypothetical protein